MMALFRRMVSTSCLSAVLSRMAVPSPCLGPNRVM